MSKVFIVDVARCNGCRNCQVACKDEHCDQAWPPYAAAEPEVGQFWIKVDEREHGTIPKVRVAYAPHGCMHCASAPCLEAAENGAVYRRDDGLVIIDPEKSQGQRAIMESCPYHAVFWNEDLNIPQKCTGCAHLLDDGWSVPRCVDACPTGALRFGEESDFAEEISRAEVLLPEAGCAPCVYYLNLPKRFVAGEVFDPVDDEVIIGATVKLLADGKVVSETTTDDFGDFWFRQLEASTYSVSISAEGFAKRELEANAMEADVNLGAIALDR